MRPTSKKARRATGSSGSGRAALLALPWPPPTIGLPGTDPGVLAPPPLLPKLALPPLPGAAIRKGARCATLRMGPYWPSSATRLLVVVRSSMDEKVCSTTRPRRSPDSSWDVPLEGKNETLLMGALCWAAGQAAAGAGGRVSGSGHEGH